MLTARGTLWAITGFFNPFHSDLLRTNFGIFLERLAVPLVCVELSFDGRFELDLRSGDRHVEVEGAHVFWQRERLLNLALRQLPPDCEYVAWIDADVVFLSDDWPARAANALQDKDLIQLFSHLHDAPQPVRPGTPATLPDAADLPTRTSLVKFLSENPAMVAKVFRVCGLSLDHGYSPGHAWAMRSSAIRDCGFFDTLILGSADKALAAAAYGRQEDVRSALRLCGRHLAAYLDWAQHFQRTVQAKIGHIDGAILHLFHGKLSNRMYDSRYSKLERFDVDPVRDLRLNGQGVWEWKSVSRELNDFLGGYFRSRLG